MNNDQRVMRLFEQAVELGQSERVEFLDQKCSGDPQLRARLDLLISNLHESDGFLEQEVAASCVAPVDPSPNRGEALRAGELLCDRYRIRERIGSGGTGDVYRATDQRLERDVAIKSLNRAMLLSDEMRQRFDREVRSVAALSHASIVSLYDITDHDGIPLAIMEYVNGRTLREHADRGLSPRDALRIARDIAAGLDAAHQQGVMHRDIKPENVMVTSGGAAKVLDFGLARQETTVGDQSLTDTHQTPGTPPYMSPEQVLAGEIGCATDIFSLGTVLFETLTGSNPFRAPSAMETMQRISQRPIQSLAEMTDSLPDGLIALVTTMLDRRSDRRPSAALVFEQINELLSDSNLDLRVTDAATGQGSTLSQQELITPPTVEPPTNLPLRSVKLTGRNSELAELSERLRGGRIVTVLGAGGVGKTSLAYEAARQLRASFPGGVWLCELAPLRRRSGVLGVLAGVLDGNAGAINKFEEVVARLDGEPTLVLLDNCEHVIDAAAELTVRLSRQLPNLTLLTTSREALSVTGESVLRLEGLDLADAATLFAERASEQASFQEDSQLEDLVKQIVQELEGLPLAIELAVPKLGVMTLTELLEALDNQTVTLRAGRRSRKRQSAIEQTIAWSFDLLEPAEQETLLTLSVFAAWFTSEAAVEVSGIGPQAKVHLLRLVEQSVVARKESLGRSRYRLLEPIRQFCQARVSERLLKSIGERHARFYSSRAVVLGKGVSGYDEYECLEALNDEWPDLREAFAWGREHSRVEYAVDPLIALDRTAMFHLRTEVFHWLIAAEKVFGEQFATRADAYAVIANGHWIMGDANLAEASLDRSRSIEVTSQNSWVSFFLRGTQARYEEALKHAQEARELAEVNGEELELRWASNSLPVVLLTLVDPFDRRIEEVIANAKARLTEVQWPTGNAILHLAKGNVAKVRGQIAEAFQQRSRAIEIASGCGSRWIELIAKITIPDDADESLPPRRRLEKTLANLRALIDLNEKASLPIAMRSLVLSIIACQELEAAVRCSAAVELLRGMGEDSKLNVEYGPMIEKLRSQVGNERFAQLRKEGASLTPEDLVVISEDIIGSTK